MQVKINKIVLAAIVAIVIMAYCDVSQIEKAITLDKNAVLVAIIGLIGGIIVAGELIFLGFMRIKANIIIANWGEYQVNKVQ